MNVLGALRTVFKMRQRPSMLERAANSQFGMAPRGTCPRESSPDGVSRRSCAALVAGAAGELAHHPEGGRQPPVNQGKPAAGHAAAKEPRVAASVLQFLAINFPDVSPVALSVGPVEIKWYGLAYGVGLLAGWLYVRRLVATPSIWPPDQKPFPPDLATDLLLCSAIGVVLGGRLGNVLLYEPRYYWQPFPHMQCAWWQALIEVPFFSILRGYRLLVRSAPPLFDLSAVRL